MSQNKKNHKKALVKYCSFAWGLSAVITVTCLVVDHLGVIRIGYGKKETDGKLIRCISVVSYTIQVTVKNRVSIILNC